MFTEFDTDLYDPLLAADLDEADPDQLYRAMVSTQLRIRQLERQEQLRQSATRVLRPLSARLVEEYTRRGPELERQLLEGLRRILVSRLASKLSRYCSACLSSLYFSSSTRPLAFCTSSVSCGISSAASLSSPSRVTGAPCSLTCFCSSIPVVFKCNVLNPKTLCK